MLDLAKRIKGTDRLPWVYLNGCEWAKLEGGEGSWKIDK